MTTSSSPEDRATVDVWSDIMCPYCYLGHTLLARATEQFDHPVEIRYHSFQLMPDLAEGRTVELNELLENERGIPRPQAEAMNASVAARAAQLGLEYRMDRVLATNTRSAHRLSHLAKEYGHQYAMIERLFRAYFTDGLDVGDHEVLADLAAEVGLDREQARQALVTGAHDHDVDADIDHARQLGITGVPFFVFNGTHAISGAQPVEAFLHALDTAQTAAALAQVQKRGPAVAPES